MQLKFEVMLSREIDIATERLLQGDWSQNSLYAAWLAQTFHFVSHTGRLICQTAGRFSLEQQDFHKMMTSHFSEEEDHELMAKRDIEAMGFSLATFPELAITRVFHEHLSYQIAHISPFCTFGRIYFLEGLACQAGPEILARLDKETLNKSGTFLKLHAEEDQHHHAESLKLLARMSAADVAQVRRGFEDTVAIYESITRTLLAHSNGASKVKAA